MISRRMKRIVYLLFLFAWTVYVVRRLNAHDNGKPR
jgi:hypothetical protein